MADHIDSAYEALVSEGAQHCHNTYLPEARTRGLTGSKGDIEKSGSDGSDSDRSMYLSLLQHASPSTPSISDDTTQDFSSGAHSGAVPVSEKAEEVKQMGIQLAQDQNRNERV